MIEFKNINKIYHSKKGPDTIALQNINLKLGDKGLVFITGKSGSGKSTLLHILGGLDNANSGEFLINGTNTSTWSAKDYDAYRNSYVGFIFQEFNLLENYNVEENIALALELQEQKPSLEKIQELLTKLDLTGLEKRKINELSGGQKQRVAILRAIIKNPQLILADEPTGNLDETSGTQIFEILKSLSKDSLVVVVSHDMDFALKYADEIIHIKDGKIDETKGSTSNERQENIPFKQSKLSWKYIIPMAFQNIKAKPGKCLLAILLMAISLILFNISSNCFFYNQETAVLKTMQENKEYIYSIQKKDLNSLSNQIIPFTKEDFSTINTYSSSTLNKSYSINNNNKSLTFTFNNMDNWNLQFPIMPKIQEFVEVEDERILNLLIGHAPQNKNEIVIHQYMADYILKYGVLDTTNTYYTPSTYEELITSNHKSKLGDNEVLIVGIINDNQEKFSIDNIDMYSDIYSYYIGGGYIEKSSVVYVHDFTNQVILNHDNTGLLEQIKPIGDPEKQISSLKVLNTPINVSTKNGLETINHLESNQIVVSLEYLKKIDEDFLSAYTNAITNIEISLDQFLTDYLNNFPTTINLYYENKIYLFDVIGITKDPINFISDDFLNNIAKSPKQLIKLYVYEDNKKELHKMFTNINFEVSRYLDKTYQNYYEANSSIISLTNSISNTYRNENIRHILIFCILLFSLFTVLLLLNFINNTISLAKKDIGILRSLGATKKDIQKIFGAETMITSFIAWLLGIFGNYFTFF